MTEFDQTAASRAVLIEVANVLGAFRNHLVVIGGWVPELCFPNQEHIGSLDVDLAVAPAALSDNAYRSICARMLDAGYTHHTSPTRFVKEVAGVPEPVKVDLISGEYHVVSGFDRYWGVRSKCSLPQLLVFEWSPYVHRECHTSSSE